MTDEISLPSSQTLLGPFIFSESEEENFGYEAIVSEEGGLTDVADDEIKREPAVADTWEKIEIMQDSIIRDDEQGQPFLDSVAGPSRMWAQSSSQVSQSQQSIVYVDQNPTVSTVAVIVKSPEPRVASRVGRCSNSATGFQPSMAVWPGDLQFEFRIDHSEKSKDPQYSTILNKLYICQRQAVKIYFRCRQTVDDDLYIRAVVVFPKADFLTEPVKVCPSHSLNSNGKLRGPLSDHLMSYVGGEDTVEYGTDPFSKRDFVLIKYPVIYPGSTEACVTYMFNDLSSCTGGINRKDTTVIFTLEHGNGEVIGRQILQLKICTSPKRDMRCDEKHSSQGQNIEPESSYASQVMNNAALVSPSVPSTSDKKRTYWVLTHGEENYRALSKMAKLLEKKDNCNLQAWREAMQKKNFPNGGSVLTKIKAASTSEEESSS